MSLRKAAEQLINHWDAGEYKNCTGDMAGHVHVLRDALVKPEWVGLDGEIPNLGLVTEEFYNGMIVAEDILREKNGDRQCPSCGGFCKKSGCERENTKPKRDNSSMGWAEFF
jgi:hypothetical protein